jgi:hypothetical protein
LSVFTNPSSGSAEHAAAYTAAVLELLGSANPITVLKETPIALRDSFNGLTDQQVGEREAAGKWSVRHVVQHLADSDLVWGWRLRIILAQDRPQITGYDQDLWAERLHYDQADVKEALTDFGVLRRANLRLLSQASPQDLKRVGVHAERGEESIERLIRLYAGHDLLHLRQVERIRRAVVS